MKEYDAKKQIQLGEYPYKVKRLQKVLNNIIHLIHQSKIMVFMLRNEKDVQDEDMAHFYTKSGAGASNTIGRKFASKRENEGKINFM